MADDARLHEIFDAAQRYDTEDSFERFLNTEFFHYGPAARVAILQGWDAKMELETAPSRATAELIARKRRMDDVHAILSRAGR